MPKRKPAGAAKNVPKNRGGLKSSSSDNVALNSAVPRGQRASHDEPETGSLALPSMEPDGVRPAKRKELEPDTGSLNLPSMKGSAHRV